MKVFYSPYTLTPLKAVNRLSQGDKAHGVFVKAVLKNTTLFADYFPHMTLGDRTVDEFLTDFKFQTDEYDKKVLDRLFKDETFQRLKTRTFFNHKLWAGIGELDSPVIKYKIMSLEDRNFIYALEKNVRVRLDANGLFDNETFKAFKKDIPEKYLDLIDYIEDPMQDPDWTGIEMKTARDFVAGSPADFYIYKPSCEFRPQQINVIYSSYLSSEFGKWQSYGELCLEGDLRLTHGIVTKGFYQEETNLFDGTYGTCFLPNHDAVRGLYQDLSDKNWKLLCSI